MVSWVTDQLKSTPLHSAAQRGTVELVELLLSRGADVTAQNQVRGYVMRFYSVWSWSLWSETPLLSFGCVKARRLIEKDNETPLQIAKSEIAEVLQRHISTWPMTASTPELHFVLFFVVWLCIILLTMHDALYYWISDYILYLSGVWHRERVLIGKIEKKDNTYTCDIIN